MVFKHKLKHKVLTPIEVVSFVSELKKEGKKIVFTNGCFDLFHLGHMEYLMMAKDLGDVLIVGVNTDDSIKGLKGPKRPIMPEEHRCYNLAAYSFVDAVIPFEEQTPLELIKIISPDLLVKGSDYKPEDIVGYDVVKAYGGEIKTISTDLPSEIYSTTKIIERVILSEK